MSPRKQSRWVLLALAVSIVALSGCAISLQSLRPEMFAGAVATPTAIPTPTPQPMPLKAPDLTGLTDDQINAILDAAEALTVKVYDDVSPSVVHITSRVVQMGFWGAFPSEGTGSGFVIDDQGHIVTNYHVVQGAQTIEITLRDETAVPAEVVGVDPLNDLAVLSIQVDPVNCTPSI